MRDKCLIIHTKKRKMIKLPALKSMLKWYAHWDRHSAHSLSAFVIDWWIVSHLLTVFFFFLIVLNNFRWTLMLTRTWKMVKKFAGIIERDDAVSVATVLMHMTRIYMYQNRHQIQPIRNACRQRPVIIYQSHLQPDVQRTQPTKSIAKSVRVSVIQLFRVKKW